MGPDKATARGRSSAVLAKKFFVGFGLGTPSIPEFLALIWFAETPEKPGLPTAIFCGHFFGEKNERFFHFQSLAGDENTPKLRERPKLGGFRSRKGPKVEGQASWAAGIELSLASFFVRSRGVFSWCLWWVWGKRARVSLDFSERGKAWAEAVIGVVVPASTLFEGSTGFMWRFFRGNFTPHRHQRNWQDGNQFAVGVAAEEQAWESMISYSRRATTDSRSEKTSPRGPQTWFRPSSPRELVSTQAGRDFDYMD